MRQCSLLLYLLPILLVQREASAVLRDFPSDNFTKDKICIGTNGRMSVPSNREHHYRNLRDRYTNCTYVDGNLELTWLEDDQLDLSFLQYIREVTGYVLISHVHVRRIVLPSLQIIRGRTLFKLTVHDEEFALMATLSKMYSLEMPALRDILQGSVGMFNNYNLCHIKHIDWAEIISESRALYVYVYNFTEPERKCPPCDESCAKGCWGEGPHNCQEFSKVTCSPQCHQGRCFGPKPRECCHLFCAGGCTGPKQTDCLACRNFYDAGVCKQECPSMQRYNPITYSWEMNPDGKYAYGATCVKHCPQHLLKDSGACVRMCPQKKKAVNGECVPCDGPCPKTCSGVGSVHAGNVDSFADCTVIDGSITILDQSFNGFQEIYQNFTFGPRYQKMHPDKLEVFSTLREITGYISIQGSHQDFRNLSYFRNLEVIGGRETTEYFASLYIIKTSLKSLNLKSLKEIRAGAVAILENKDLCFAQSINWTQIVKGDENEVRLLQNNRDKEECVREGLVCHQQCSEYGCWGPAANECLSCANYRLRDSCIESCEANKGLYDIGGKVCHTCHSECNNTCNGPGPDNCTECLHVRDGPYCVPKCPESKYKAVSSTDCLPCHEFCVDGCTGPEPTLGPNGCISCEKAIIKGNGRVERCLDKDDSCPPGYYFEWVGPQETGALRPLAGKSVCRPCHPRCKECTAYGFHVAVCQKCVHYRRDEMCEDECRKDDYYADEVKNECIKCASECIGCHGPLKSDCIRCRNYRIYLDPTGNGNPVDNNTAFNCTASCTDEYPYKIFPENSGDPYCAKQGNAERVVDTAKIPAILGGIFGCVAMLGLFVAGVGYRCWQIQKSKENTIKMTMRMSGFDDNEPLKPTNVKPNLAKLRIVTEAELRKGGILGYGAFGTVYKGVWVPEGENVKIPVAIKVLREGMGARANREILEEAYIMASVEHSNLLQLLAVCMTSQVMLVTQLMPLGCLLDYTRNNREKIGSKPLLNWCTQIARGMAYLEERSIVHRDLAARNVLVQTPNCVRITDFGLAKLLDCHEDEYKAAGGKMPIKWLALECIQHRIFTHKSDVWAFGVTVWEILTYGERPYEHVPAREVPDLLEKGERLPQPPICTIDVYMIMIKCWMLDAESRPSFKELADEFAKMARDPGRYLVIKGDKFMRLPSYTPQDEKELIRNLSSAMEGPGVIMDAEEYLQPKCRANPHPPSPAVSPAPTDYGVPPESPQNLQNYLAELRYRQESGMDPPPYPYMSSSYPQPRSRESSDRYCSDPLKLAGKDLEMGDDECFEDNRITSNIKVGGIPLQLPVDEDDYLMPSPQGFGSSPHYMDLIPDTKSTDATDGRNAHYVPDFVPVNGHAVMGLDNPEYHIMNGSPHPTGVPYPTSSVNNGKPPPPFTNGTTTGPNLRNSHFVPHQRNSAEEESDEHEYYNDLERLQKERQPLQSFRRNETTV